jgi:hypothetical protein
MLKKQIPKKQNAQHQVATTHLKNSLLQKYLKYSLLSSFRLPGLRVFNQKMN